MSATQSGVQPTGVRDPNAKTITWKLVLTRTYELYAAKFWAYFRIAIVPAVIAYAFSYFARIAIRQLVRADFFLLSLESGWRWLQVLSGPEAQFTGLSAPSSWPR
ncbi:MAG TPA: hypothetical protein VJW55_15945 [Candidatus Angelobacter sp.]|nr:hypothetical protein [Candidatus Angelobacter sp.]